MRATGFGFKSPKDYTGDYRYPMRKSDGTNLNVGYKSISEKRRELLFLTKMGLNQPDSESTLQTTIDP